jgi:c-di-GMP-related signal transduction protein
MVSPVEVVVARQAIFDRAQDVVGYELLFRSVDAHNTAEQGLDGDVMTSSVLFSSMNIGIERLVGDKLIFCNADRGLLTGSVPIMLPPERTVIEILETVAPDDEVLAGCRRLAGHGYRLALDDFVWFDGAERFLEVVSLVKIDLRRIAMADLPVLVARCRMYGVQLLAEKIETPEELEACLALGFDYLQGYALSRPRNVSGRTLETSNLVRLRIAASLVGSEYDLTELESIIRTEPGLTYQLLQLAGAGAQRGLRRDIRTIRDALIMVGSRRVQNWLALLMLRPTGPSANQDLAQALTRARMCEFLAGTLSSDLAPLGFTAGILSSFEILLGIPVDEIAKTLPLDDELREAAFGDSSPLAKIVRDVADYQAGRTDGARRSRLTTDELDLASMRALSWAVDATQGLTPAL